MSLTKTPICDFGKKAENFQLNATSNKIVSLKDVKGENGTLIMFICNHCPYVKAVITEIVQVCKKLELNGVKAVAICSNDVKNYPEDSFENMIEFSKENVNKGRAQVGYVSHQSFLYNELTGFENLEFYGNLYDFREPRTRASEMLIKMGLEKVGQRLVREYSRGMKQRLTLARALLHVPSLLLLDEPYTGLDQHGSRLLTSVLRNVKEEGSTVILITHNLAGAFPNEAES